MTGNRTGVPLITEILDALDRHGYTRSDTAHTAPGRSHATVSPPRVLPGQLPEATIWAVRGDSISTSAPSIGAACAGAL